VSTLKNGSSSKKVPPFKMRLLALVALLVGFGVQSNLGQAPLSIGLSTLRAPNVGPEENCENCGLFYFQPDVATQAVIDQLQTGEEALPFLNKVIADFNQRAQNTSQPADRRCMA